MKSTGLIKFVSDLHQAGKIHNLHQAWGVSGCVRQGGGGEEEGEEEGGGRRGGEEEGAQFELSFIQKPRHLM